MSVSCSSIEEQNWLVAPPKESFTAETVVFETPNRIRARKGGKKLVDFVTQSYLDWEDYARKAHAEVVKGKREWVIEFGNPVSKINRIPGQKGLGPQSTKGKKEKNLA